LKCFSVIDVREFYVLCFDLQDEAVKLTEEVADVSVKEIVSVGAQNGPSGDVSLM
jgi:hypothetical protein